MIATTSAASIPSRRTITKLSITAPDLLLTTGAESHTIAPETESQCQKHPIRAAMPHRREAALFQTYLKRRGPRT